MKTHWFKKIGWFYIPINAIGYVLTLCSILFLLNIFLAIDKNSHSVSDTLYGIFPFFASVFFIYNWVATNSSK